MKYKVIPFEQPVGTLLLATMTVKELLRISSTNPRKFDSQKLETTGGIQREPSSKRAAEIAAYADTVDATFPTPILLAIKEGDYEFENDQLIIEKDGVADIVDGQHRVLGLKMSNLANEKFIMPVVFLLDVTEEQKALIFAIINGKQTKVPASVIYDLFGVAETRSPQKTAHEIARAMNSNVASPWYKRLKMLGKKTPGSAESLSQGTFVKFLLPHISSDPTSDMDMLKRGKKPKAHEKCIFNSYFREDQDATILKILMNLFRAVRNCWPDEWGFPEEAILTKTTGYAGIMRALPRLVEYGKAKGELSEKYFQEIFEAVNNKMKNKGLTFSSKCFPPSAESEANLKKMIESVIPDGLSR